MNSTQPDAKATVRGILNRLGWLDDTITDLGPLHSARATEAVVLLVPHILGARGMRPFAITAVE